MNRAERKNSVAAWNIHAGMQNDLRAGDASLGVVHDLTYGLLWFIPKNDKANHQIDVLGKLSPEEDWIRRWRCRKAQARA
jgi:hypothetical protein